MRSLWFLVLAATLTFSTSGAGAAQADALAAIDALIKAGRYAEAEKAALAALADAEGHAGLESVEAAHAINRLADARLRQGRTDAQTERLIERAVAIETRAEPGSRDLAAAQSNSASLFESRGDFRTARDWYARTLDTMRAALGPEHRETLLAQKDLAMVWNSLGEFARARALVEDALATRLTQDPEHVDVAVLRHNLGAIEWQMGDYAGARDAFLAASAGLMRAYGPNHPHVASALEGLAVIQTNLGQHAEARAAYRRVLAIRERVLPPGHPQIGQTYVNLGDVEMSMGDNAAALRALRKGLAIWENTLGPNHPQLLIALTNLAVARDRLGDHAGARAALRRGIAIREQTKGPDDPDLIIPLTQLANLLADDGLWTEARAAYERARRLGAKTRGEDHPYVAATELEEGLRLAARGEIAEAAPLVEHARAIRLKTLGPEHPQVAEVLDATARLAASRGDMDQAIGGALDAEAMERRHFQSTAAVLPERDALLYAEGRARSQDLAVFLAARTRASGQTIARLWDAVVRSRALVLDEMSGRRRLASATGTPVRREVVDAAANARARLAQLFLRGPSADQPSEYARELAAAREEKERAEERLALESAAVQRDRQLRAAGFDAVRQALPRDAALVSFLRYETGIFTAPARVPRFAYAAFVLPAGGEHPVLLHLGDAGAVDALVARWRAHVRNEATAPPMGAAPREQAYRRLAAALRAKVWDPVAPHVAHAARVLIVPDGALHLVDFSTLPSRRTEYLVENGPTLHQATAERDLIASTAAPGSGLLAVGAPAFDGIPAPGAGPAPPPLRSDCAAAPGVRFAPLPESGREVEAIARLWRERAGPAVLLRGTNASERSVKARAPGHRVLHLATHGFVMGEGCQMQTRGTAAVRTTAAQTLASNPLLGAGLVLAGASRRTGRGTAAEDGILTAEEISGLDLSGVEWAVLSACDSGTGVARAGEGIFGLRRAFQIAGVRTVIVSLWPVEDRHARSWMERLYSARLVRHRSTDEAVRDASRAALEARRRAGASTHPWYWSGFVAAGDWR